MKEKSTNQSRVFPPSHFSWTQIVSVGIWWSISWLMNFYPYHALFAQEQQKIDPQALSLLNVVVANAEGMKQGDVLIFERRFYDGILRKDEILVGGTLDNLVFKRVFFDIDKGKFTVLTKSIFEWMELDKKDNTVKIVKDAVVIDFNSKKYFSSANKELEKDYEPHIFGNYDPRSIGILGIEYREFAQTQSFFNSKRYTADDLESYKSKKDGDELTLSFNSDQHSRAVIQYQFFRESSLPQKITSFSRLNIGGQTKPKTIHYEWQEMKDVFVPIRIRNKYAAMYPSPSLNQERRTGDADIDIRLHWFSVNEPIALELFDKSLLKDEQRIQELIDPVKSEATSIIEILKSESPKPNDTSPLPMGSKKD